VGKFFKQNWCYILAGIFVLALFFTRLYHLTILPVFADEAIYVRWAQVMRAEETLRFLPLSDGKQPLFMWLIIPFFKMFSDPLFAGRFVSVLAGLGTLVGISLLSFLLFKSVKVSLAAAVIYAVCPFTFFFDRMALADSLLSMFGVWTFIFSYLAIKNKRLDFAMLAGFSLGGAWLTKSPALFFALMLPTMWLFADWKKNLKSNFFVLLRSAGLSIVTAGIGYGMYNILRFGTNFHMIASRNLDYVWPLSHILSNPFDPLNPFLLQVWQWINMMGPWPVWILSILGIAMGFARNWKQKLILGIWFLAPVVVQSEFAKVFTARYILFSLPYLIIIAGSAFAEEKKNLARFLVFILAFFVAQAVIFDYQLLTNPQRANLPRSERSGYLEEWTAGQGIKEIADYIRREQTANPKDKFVVGTEGYFGTLPDGLQMYLNDMREVIVIGVGLNFDKLPSELVNSKKAGNKTFFVVNNSRLHGSSESLGLTQINFFQKAIAPNRVRDSLLLFSVNDQVIKIYSEGKR